MELRGTTFANEIRATRPPWPPLAPMSEIAGRLAAVGVDAALGEDPGFACGLNVKDGEITYAPVAEGFAQGGPVASW